MSAEGTASRPRLSTLEKIAVAVSAAILLTAAVWWTVQVLDVIATLKLAYG